MKARPAAAKSLSGFSGGFFSFEIAPHDGRVQCGNSAAQQKTYRPIVCSVSLVALQYGVPLQSALIEMASKNQPFPTT
ncbi:MAG: hypothetical protein ACI83P_000080 [Janthinobacterium sp.]|jgi:hypothetical protein